MTVAIWIVSGILAVAYLLVGGLKLITPAVKLHDSMAWTRSTATSVVRLIAVVELLGAVGIILPAALNIAPVLSTLAALGLVLVQIGAIIVHVRLKETGRLAPNIVLLVLALFVFVARVVVGA